MCNMLSRKYLKWKEKNKLMKGGKRANAGRPRSAPTKTISFRVKLEHVEPIKAMIRAYLDSN